MQVAVGSWAVGGGTRGQLALGSVRSHAQRPETRARQGERAGPARAKTGLGGSRPALHLSGSPTQRAGKTT